ncbi:hypothetical protein HZH66_005532 [Vespula vulgaris]|uniref:Uncharacterized protein n=1 Tax=Vespula vulgaris TaxID=7454 RepID=A0A834K5C6_VESVU|nr:hypothetical protein HZH66_005532 [Vespula vulgaris]
MGGYVGQESLALRASLIAPGFLMGCKEPLSGILESPWPSSGTSRICVRYGGAATFIRRLRIPRELATRLEKERCKNSQRSSISLPPTEEDYLSLGVKFRRECAVIKKGVAPIHRSHLPENCLEMGRRKDVTGDGATLLPEDDDDDEDAVVEEDGVSIIKWFIFLRSAKSALIA